MYCADCESVDDYFFDQTCFWIFVPTAETFGKLIALCGSAGYSAKQETTHCISVIVDSNSISRFLISINGALESVELEGTKVTTTATPQQPELKDIGRMTTFNVLINRHQAKWLIASIENQRFESWYQPIVHAKTSLETPTHFAHEALFRIRDESNTIVPPSLAFKLAENSDLLFSMDLIARRAAVECAAKGKLTGKLFINFNPSSIYDPAYCLRATAASINEIGLQPQDVVFEVTETHKASDINHLKGILAFYRSVGFQVALDDIGSGWSGLNLLQVLRPDYVKIDMELVRGLHNDTYKQNIVSSLIRIARKNGIEVIAEGVEEEAEAKWLIAAKVDYLQGYLFGKPAPLTQNVNDQQKLNIESSLHPLAEAAKNKGS